MQTTLETMFRHNPYSRLPFPDGADRKPPVHRTVRDALPASHPASERIDASASDPHNSAPHSAPVAQLDRVPGYEPGGREFESLRAHQFFRKRRACLGVFCFPPSDLSPQHSSASRIRLVCAAGSTHYPYPSLQEHEADRPRPHPAAHKPALGTGIRYPRPGMHPHMLSSCAHAERTPSNTARRHSGIGKGVRMAGRPALPGAAAGD